MWKFRVPPPLWKCLFASVSHSKVSVLLKFICFYFIIYLFIHLWRGGGGGGEHECRCPWWPEEETVSPGTGITVYSGAPDVGPLEEEQLLLTAEPPLPAPRTRVGHQCTGAA